MTTLESHTTEPIAPPRAAKIDEVLQQALASHISPQLFFDGQSVDLPIAVRKAIIDLLQRFASGNGVVIGSINSSLTTSQAAELLGISRTYIVRMIEQGRIPAHHRGTHRRIYLKDVLSYSENARRERTSKLDEIAKLSARTGQYADDF